MPDLQRKICPKCGASIEDYRRTGLWGCGECYRVFREEILTAVRAMQGGMIHEGKTPVDSLIAEQEQLKKEIEDALRAKRFEEAERLQEEWKLLKTMTETE